MCIRDRFRVARNNADLEAVPEGVFIVLSTSMLGKLKRGDVYKRQMFAIVLYIIVYMAFRWRNF